MINDKLRAVFENRIQDYLEYYNSTNFENETKKWVENWKNKRKEVIRKIEAKEIWASPGYVESYDEMCLEIPAIHEEYGEQIQNEINKAIRAFRKYDLNENCNEFAKRLKKCLEGIIFLDPKEKVQALFIEFGSHPDLNFYPYLPDKYELIFEEKKHLKYNSGDLSLIHI